MSQIRFCLILFHVSSKIEIQDSLSIECRSQDLDSRLPQFFLEILNLDSRIQDLWVKIFNPDRLQTFAHANVVHPTPPVLSIQNIGVQNPKFKRHQLSNGEYIRYPEIKNQNPSEQFRSWIGFGMVWDFGPAGELPLVWWGGVLKSPTLSSWWAWVRGSRSKALMVNGLPLIIDCVVAPRKTFELRLSAELTMLGMIFGNPISDFQNLFFKGCQCKKPSVWAISAVSGFGDMMQNGIGRGIPCYRWSFGLLI